jgi:hypothetical protein
MTCLSKLNAFHLENGSLTPEGPTVTNVSFYHFQSCNCGFVFCHDFLKILMEVGE